MAIDPKALAKPLARLRKLIRKMSKVPTQDEVHDIRTNTRRVEAALAALQLDRKRKGKRVLRVLGPMRRDAGDVRDLDVLTGFAATLGSNKNHHCLVKLLEHLGEKRARSARKLSKTVAKRKKQANHRLKVCSSLIEENFLNHTEKQQKEWPIDAAATALCVSGELATWPRLGTKNLHPFRLKVKELRYVLQLSGDANELTDRLGEVKNQIGEWHDWTELGLVAKKVLSGCKDCEVVTRVGKITKEKLEIALRSAQMLRSTYFEPKGKNQKRRRRPATVKEPMLAVTARLAA